MGGDGSGAAPAPAVDEAGDETAAVALNLSLGAPAGEGTSGKASWLRAAVDGGRYVVKQVPVKRGPSGGVCEERAVEAVLNEVRLHRRLSAECSSIVRYVFAHLNGEELVVIMEACDLELWEALTDKWSSHLGAAPGPRDQLLALSVQLCEAVSHCHRFCVLHRDINPWNVFVVSDPGRIKPWSLRLADFGLAAELPNPEHLLEGMEAPGAAPLDESALGSLYSAPELGERYGLAADVFSIGMTLLALWSAGDCGGDSSALTTITESAKEEAAAAAKGGGGGGKVALKSWSVGRRERQLGKLVVGALQAPASARPKANAVLRALRQLQAPPKGGLLRCLRCKA